MIVEIKSSPADLRADRKWRDYAACCDRLYFAISEATPPEIMPPEAGLILADSLRRGNPARSRFPAHGLGEPPGASSCASPRPPPTGCTGSPTRLACRKSDGQRPRGRAAARH